MIGYLKGKVLSSENGTVLLENNGVGYEITCSNQVYAKLLGAGEGEVYTYMAVKEDGISLYGFLDAQEKRVFLQLISVSGVGPKMGITILSNVSVGALVVAIANSDVKALSSIKGLGKKTAERIILELREKVGEVDLSADGVGDMPSASLATTPEQEDAVVALLSLGFSKTECVKAVKEAVLNGAESTQQLIAYAIKNIK